MEAGRRGGKANIYWALGVPGVTLMIYTGYLILFFPVLLLSEDVQSCGGQVELPRKGKCRAPRQSMVHLQTGGWGGDVVLCHERGPIW